MNGQLSRLPTHCRHRPLDYPNQINNVLGFPFIFRGALDVRCGTINDEMKLPPLMPWPKRPANQCHRRCAQSLQPRPPGIRTRIRGFPSRLIRACAPGKPAVAKAAMESALPASDWPGCLSQNLKRTPWDSLLNTKINLRTRKELR
jgi:hypothetical protein